MLRPALEGLKERDRLILRLRFVGGCTQEEIGRELGVSQMQVSRLLGSIMARLRAGLADPKPHEPWEDAGWRGAYPPSGSRSTHSTRGSSSREASSMTDTWAGDFADIARELHEEPDLAADARPHRGAGVRVGRV